MTMVLDASDPLVDLGLVDPNSGKPLETSDWKPDAPKPDSTVSDQHDQEREVSEQNQQQTPTDGGVNPNTGQPAAAQPDPKTDARTYVQTEQTRLQNEAQQAIWLLTQYGVQGPDGQMQKMDPAQAQQLVAREMQNQMNEVQRQADRIALAPMAKEMAARDIAKEFSLPGVKLDASELLSEETPAAMKGRARALAEERRGKNFDTRKNERRDQVEGGATPHQPNTDNLTSFDKIRLGLLRGE